MTEPLLRFVHISDTHLSHDPDYARDWAPYHPRPGVEALVEQINALPFAPDFVLHTGDVVAAPDAAAYRLARELLGRIRFPVYYLAGNHDDPAMLQRELLGTERPVEPFDYHLEVNGVQIVCLDSTGPAEPPAGSIRSAQLARLADLCASADRHPLVVALHHNALPTGIPWLDDYMGLTNGLALHRALLPARHRLRGVFSGHIHQNTQTLRDGILYASVVSSWYQIHAWPGQTETVREPGAQPGYNIVTVTPEQTFIRCYRYALPD
jgi:Icc protein